MSLQYHTGTKRSVSTKQVPYEDCVSVAQIPIEGYVSTVQILYDKGCVSTAQVLNVLDRGCASNAQVLYEEHVSIAQILNEECVSAAEPLVFTRVLSYLERPAPFDRPLSRAEGPVRGQRLLPMCLDGRCCSTGGVLQKAVLETRL
ncbi:hypothetical protein NDU88_005484 [Pleurodeles waltl]|uniref:Uncharacterized protein n=1 Tax=Pleurodeles waltl TaxID=8319 RepID=A0AAV7QEW8_PLEWA|nr:hypothetical protein NDU88_005484 [Pleurodeles waltl]